MLVAAARRFGGLLLVVSSVTVGLSLLAALALGGSLGRAVPTGLYLVGSFLIVVGVLAGVRGPVRPKEGDDGRDAVSGLFGFGIFSQGIRTATADDRRDARATAWLFFSLGIAMIALGVLVDSRTSLLP